VLTVKRGHGENRLEEEVALTDKQLAALWPLTEFKRRMHAYWRSWRSD
jgi:hypothetical protein